MSEIRSRFVLHVIPSTGVHAYRDSAEKCADLAAYMDSALPAGREKVLVMTKIEEACLWAHEAIARNPS